MAHCGLIWKTAAQVRVLQEAATRPKWNTPVNEDASNTAKMVSAMATFQEVAKKAIEAGLLLTTSASANCLKLINGLNVPEGFKEVACPDAT